MLTKTDITKAVARFDELIQAAHDERVRVFQKASEQGMPQKDLVEASGYSRETVRRIVNPEAVEAAKKRRATKAS